MHSAAEMTHGVLDVGGGSLPMGVLLQLLYDVMIMMLLLLLLLLLCVLTVRRGFSKNIMIYAREMIECSSRWYKTLG
jgi:hypothetical protein